MGDFRGLSGRAFDGSIRPRNIGVRDFWNRLTRAYQDLLINEELQRRNGPGTKQQFVRS